MPARGRRRPLLPPGAPTWSAHAEAVALFRLYGAQRDTGRVAGEDRPAGRLRESCRALLFDGDDRVLLGQHRIPTGTVWAAVGGGVEAGESLTQALQRELREETGLDLRTAGASEPVEVWTQQAELPGLGAQGWDGVVNHYFLVRVERFEPPAGPNPATAASTVDEGILALRWWSLAELRSAGSEPGVVFSPRALPTLLSELMAATDLPETPLLLGL